MSNYDMDGYALLREYLTEEICDSYRDLVGTDEEPLTDDQEKAVLDELLNNSMVVDNIREQLDCEIKRIIAETIDLESLCAEHEEYGDMGG